MTRLVLGLVVFLAACTGRPATNHVPANERATPAAATPVATPESTIVKPLGGGEFTKRMHSSPEGKLPYRLFLPAEYDSTKRYPLILWLHGASGSGNDNERQIEGDQIPGSRTWATPKAQAANPAFVLVPQTDAGWGIPAGEGLTPPLAMVLQILDAVTGEFPIDLRRVYLLGQSMGGSGVWDLVTLQPERFAAAVLVCPVIYHAERAPKAASVPMWIFIGDRDGLATSVRGVRDRLTTAGSTPRYTEYKGAGHDIWMKVFKEPDLSPWLFAQTR